MLKGKTALITGGSRGLGRAIACDMAKNGADVAIIYAGNHDAANETCKMVTEYGVKSKAYCLDVSDFSKCKETVKDVITEFGKVDILVNSAGITRDALVLSMKEEDFDSVVNINLKGVFNMTKQVYSHMMRKRAGRIINISSVAGIMGNAGQGNYSAAKAGVIGFTKTVAKELSGRGVTVNAIAPGLIETDMAKAMNEKAKEALIEAIPLKRMGKAEEVAALTTFLASDNAGYITGEVIKIDGGLCI